MRCCCLVLAALGLLSCGTGPEPTDDDATFALPDPPVIEHVPVVAGISGQEIAIEARVTDDDPIGAVTLFYRDSGGQYWVTRFLQEAPEDEGLFTGSIPGTAVTGSGVDYYLKATDMGQPRGETLLPEEAPDAWFSIAVLVQGLSLPFLQGFEDGSLYDAGFARYQLGFLDNEWHVRNDTSAEGDWCVAHYAPIDGTPASDDWLVSPPLDFTGLSHVGVQWMEQGLNGDAADHEILVSILGGDPTLGGFTSVAALPGPAEGWGSSALISLDPWAGEPLVWVAWRYQGQWPADRWWVDAIEVAERSAIPALGSITPTPNPIGPGDTVDLSLELQVMGDLELLGATASLASSDPELLVLSSPLTLPTIAGGDSATLGPFSFSVDANHLNHRLMPLQLDLVDGDGTAWSLPFEVLLGGNSEAVLDLSLSGGVTASVEFGVGDPQSPTWSVVQAVDSSTVMPLHQDLTAQGELLPPEPGGHRFWARVQPLGGDGIVHSLVVDWGGGTLFPSASTELLISDGGEGLLFVPEPPVWSIADSHTLLSPVAPGETASLFVDLSNLGADSSGPVSVSLSSTDADVFVVDGGPLSYGTMAGGATVLGPSGFQFSVAATHTSNSPVSLVLHVSDTVDAVDLPLSVDVPWAALALDGLTVDDSAGDNSGGADEGETVEVWLRLINTGALPSTGPVQVEVALSSESTAVATLTGTTTTTVALPIAAGATGDAATSIPLRVDGGYSGDTVVLDLTITDAGVPWFSTASIEVTPLPWLPLPTPSVDPLGDNNGYIADIETGYYKSDGRVLWLRYDSALSYDPMELLGTVLLYVLPDWWEVQVALDGLTIFASDPISGATLTPLIPLMGVVEPTWFAVRLGLSDFGINGPVARVAGTVGATCFQTSYRCDVFPSAAVSGFSLDSGSLHAVTW